MIARLKLFFPYLCMLPIVALLLWGFGKQSIVKADDPQIAVAVDGKKAADTDCCEGEKSASGHEIDFVCGMEVSKTFGLEYRERTYYFCTDQCRQSFQEKPDQYLTRSCLVCQSDGAFTPVQKDETLAAVWQEKTYYLCSLDHRGRFLEDPAGYFMHSMWGIPNWLYYSSIAVLLLLSFTLIERPSKRKSGPRALPMAGETKKEIDDKIDLTNISWVSWMFTSRYLRFSLQLIVTFLFVVVISAGLFGSQLPGKNIAPLLTWTVWWCGLVLIILYAGKAWCYVCPWDAIAGWAESLRFWGPSKNRMGLNLKWPKAMRNIWPATILFILLTWAELGFAITMSPRATAYMGLAMVGMAFVSVFLFEKKSFCRYGCLVGRISGLYALFSPIEIRAKDLSACATCSDKGCFKGSENGDPCPTSQFLPTMENNTYCISCMECFHTCDKNNVSVNLRPWGSDLVTLHKPRSDEAYLALIMLSLTAFHGLTMTRIWQDTQDTIASALNIGHTLAFSLGMVGLMVAPILVYAILVGFSKWLAADSTVSYRDYFIRYSYAMLPIALFYHLAHNSEHLFMEGQKVISLASDPYGWEWDIFGTATLSLPPLTDLSTLWLIQVFLVIVGHVYSLWVAHRISRNLFVDPRTALRSQIPMLVAMILFSVMSLWLLKQPMEMRSSAM